MSHNFDLYRVDKYFQKFVAQNTLLKFFYILSNLTNENSYSARKSIWLQYLSESKYHQEEFIKSVMATASGNVMKYFLENYLSYSFKCQKCSRHLYIINRMKAGSDFFSKTVEFKNDIKNLQQSIVNDLKGFHQRHICKDCNSNFTYTTSKVFVIQIVKNNGMNFVMNDNVAELKYSDLPQILQINRKKYHLTFMQHYVPGNGGHFITKYNLSNNTHLNIDDMGSVNIETNENLANPNFMVYFCHE